GYALLAKKLRETQIATRNAAEEAQVKQILETQGSQIEAKARELATACAEKAKALDVFTPEARACVTGTAGAVALTPAAPSGGGRPRGRTRGGEGCGAERRGSGPGRGHGRALLRQGSRSAGGADTRRRQMMRVHLLLVLATLATTACSANSLDGSARDTFDLS